MKFDEALARFQHELTLEYGPSAKLVAVAVTHETFTNVMIDYAKQRDAGLYNSYSYSPAGMNDCRINGVRFLAREENIL